MKKHGQVTTRKSTLVDEYVRQLSDLGISLKSLQLLGDFEFSDEDNKLTESELIEKILENDNYKKQKESIEKYITEFMKADLITQEPHKRRGEQLYGSEVDLSDDWVDGGVYFYRTPEKDKDGKSVELAEEEDSGNDNSETPEEETTPKEEVVHKNINTSSYGLSAEEVNIEMDGIKNEYKIAWISDLHMMQPDEPNINNEWYNSHLTTFEQRNSSFNNSYSILPKLIECLNGNDFDAIVFGGDIMDNYSEVNFQYLKEQISKIKNKQIMFLVADHDYLTEMTTNTGVNKNASSLGISGEIKQLTIGKDGDSISLVGQNYSNEKISDSAVSSISKALNKASNSLFFTHVPIESKTQASQMQQWSRNVHNNQVYYWSKEASSSGYKDVSSNYLNTLYNSSTLKGVFAGHVHATGDFELNTGIKEHIFKASFNNSIGVITITPSGNNTADEGNDNEDVNEPTDTKKYIKEINSEKYVQMQYVTPEEFQKMVNKNDKNLRYKYTIDKDTGEIKIAQLKVVKYNYIVEDSLDSSKTTIEVQEILSIDYKKYIEKYIMPYEFLITLCEITQNPEFVYHVAQLVRDTKIILVVQDDTQIEDVTVKSKEKIISQGYEIEAEIKRQTITTTMTPHMEIQYANSWSFYEEFEYTKEVQVYGPSTSDNTTTKITKIKYNPPILKNSVEKSKQFLGLLRNETGKCTHTNCYKNVQAAIMCAKDAVYDKKGINVEYLIPNSTRTETPLANLLSGENLFYDLLGESLEGNETDSASEDTNSLYKTRMAATLEHMKFLMTFPENEDLNILYGREDQYPEIDDDLEYDDIDIPEEELKILYKLCEAEAGGSSADEIGHVASVVLNRVKSSKFPNTIKKVVYQKNQFACITDGNFDKANPSNKTKDAVDIVIKNGDTTNGAFWFRTKASAKKAGMPTSASEKHDFYVYLFEDPNTHIFYTNYDYLGETVIGKPESSNNMVDSAITIHKYVRENGYKYKQAGICVPNYKTKTIDCSSYVTWVILNAGYRSSNFKEGMYQWTSATFNGNKEGWEVIKDIKDAKAGDILCYSNHVEIYAGTTKGNKPVVYNCGGNASIAAKESGVSAKTIKKINKILRVPIKN